MRVLIVIFWFCLFSPNLKADKPLRQAKWQQELTFTVKAEFVPDFEAVSGSVDFTYKNNSPDTLLVIWLHVWPNAYKDNSTAFAKQRLKQGKTDFYFSEPSQKGSIEGFDFKQDSIQGQTLKWKFHPQHQDIIQVVLNKPLLPGQTLRILSPFQTHLPQFFSRSGYKDGFYAVTQWYPKPAVYDSKGWHLLPYLDLGEFYSEFCKKIDVELTLPAQFQVAATGNLLKAITIEKNGKKLQKLLFSENNIHDFAWFTSEKLKVYNRYSVLPSGDSLLLQVFDTNLENEAANNELLKAMDFCVSNFSTMVGNYPYKTCKVVIGPEQTGSGMEYPTITLCNKAELETVFHEIGHNWFYGMLASNERDYPWMDESLNTFISNLVVHAYNRNLGNDLVADKDFYNTRKLGDYLGKHPELFSYQLANAFFESQALRTTSVDFTELNYGLVLYVKGPRMFAFLKQTLGDSVFDAGLQYYFKTWQFKHPMPGDMQHAFEHVSSRKLDWFFEDLMRSNHEVDIVQTKNGFKVIGSNRLDSFLHLTYKENPNPSGLLIESNYFNNTDQKKLLKLSIPFGMPSYNNAIHLDVMPAIGYNYYDKIYAGFILNHHTLYKQGFQFLIAPMYSFREKKPIGYANAKIPLYSATSFIRKLDLTVEGQSFSLDVQDQINTYYKLQTGLNLTLNEFGTQADYLEQLIRFDFTHTGLKDSKIQYNDSLIFNAPTAYFFNYFRASYRYDNHAKINRVGFFTESEYGTNNKFNPQANSYVKTSINATYKYRYAEKNKFFRSAFFAGIFLYRKGNFEKQKFYLTGNSGNVDYTYQQALLGRSESSSGDLLLGNQIINAGGNMRNLIPSFPTDRWMLSLNNEMSLPGILPLRLYLDLAYYKYLSTVGSNTGILTVLKKPELYYTSGLIFGFLNNTLEVFIPIVQSNQFTKFTNWNYKNIGNSIGFKLDLNRLYPDKILRQMVLTNKINTGDPL